jgi:carbon monoxide dehydrogenase subunit G
VDIQNTFTVPASLGEVWQFFLDVDEVAPCVPGAQITETIDDSHFRGAINVKLGPAQVSYRGELSVERYPDDGVMVLNAKGTGLRGMGGASAVIRAHLVEEGDGSTRVDVDTTLDISGRVAQFGRGIIADVANRQMREFASCLQEKINARVSG